MIELVDEETDSTKPLVVRIQDPSYEGIFCDLLLTLVRSTSARAIRARVAGDQKMCDYYQGQADAYSAAYQHYTELRA